MVIIITYELDNGYKTMNKMKLIYTFSECGECIDSMRPRSESVVEQSQNITKDLMPIIKLKQQIIFRATILGKFSGIIG